VSEDGDDVALFAMNSVVLEPQLPYRFLYPNDLFFRCAGFHYDDHDLFSLLRIRRARLV